MAHHHSFEIASHKADDDEQLENPHHVELKSDKTSVVGVLCESNSIDASQYNYGKNICTKEDKFSFREMAKNILFINDKDDEIKNIGQLVSKLQLPPPLQEKHFNQKKSDILQSSKSVTNVRYGEKNQDYKIVAITNIPHTISITALLNQVHGGPVERIEIVKNENYHFYNDDKLYELSHSINWREVAIFLHFSKFEDAKSFYHYSKTGIFRVNDVYLRTILIPEIDSNNKKIKTINDTISKLMIEEEKARRVLVFKKPIYDKKHKNVKKRPGYPDPVLNYSEEFDVKEIKHDFGQYGKLVEILPVVSRKLCFGIQYYDVRSAIKVKHVLSSNMKDNERAEQCYVKEFDTLSERDKIFKKKYNGWYVWYGKDPCDKSVPS